MNDPLPSFDWDLVTRAIVCGIWAVLCIVCVVAFWLAAFMAGASL